jgi:diaminopimelate decarboxylase
MLHDLDAARARVRALLDDPPPPPPAGTLHEVVEETLSMAPRLLALAEAHPTPFFAFDGAGFDAALARFRAAFDRHVPGHRPFYAIKTNHHPWVVAAAVRAGYGLDASSGRELRQALAFPGCAVLLSGPAKSDEDLALALDHAERELRRLGALSAARGTSIQAGLRVSTEQHGAWSKFGVPLPELPRLWRLAKDWPTLRLRGVQSHLSWNRDPSPYVRVIGELARTLRDGLSPEDRASLDFVDVGGGYRPHRTEGLFPQELPLGAILQAGNDAAGAETRYESPYYVKPSVPLETYASAIGEAVRRELGPWYGGPTWTEPGRIVSTYAMHIVVRVVDKKAPGLVIADGGIHMVGWEKYLQVYSPVVNLSRPARAEIPLRIGGSLCDCEDVLGLRCFAESVEEGDVLVIPFQGAYSFVVAQDFIRPIPEVLAMGG